MSLLLPAKKAMIAARLGLTPETFSRVLKRLREEHLITVEKLKIHIHRPSALRQWAKDDRRRDTNHGELGIASGEVHIGL